MRKHTLLICVLIALICFTGCAKKSKDKSVPAPQPNTDIWNDPGIPNALMVTDPQGDDLSAFGDKADWRMMKGTYDTHFAYLWFDIWDVSGVDMTGNVYYYVSLDVNATGVFDVGDYVVGWNALDGLSVVDFSGNPVSPDTGIYFRLGTGLNLEIAIKRNLVNPVGFGVEGLILWWDGANWQYGDDIPDGHIFAYFSF